MNIRAFLVVGLLFIAGCTGSLSGPSQAGKAVLLDAAPDGASGVVELKSNLIAGLASGESILEGRIGNGDAAETWDTGQAAFLVRDLDLVLEEHGEEHGDDHAANCKFCQAAKAQQMESMALIRIVDETGQVIAKDARELVGLKENQIVVALGEGTVEDGTLVFDAKQLFIRE